MKLKILTGALALLLTGSVLTGFSTQAAPSKAESGNFRGCIPNGWCYRSGEL